MLAPKVLDLNESVATMEKLLRRLIGEHINLVTAPAPTLWRVKADPAQLEALLALGRDDIGHALRTLEALVAVAPTVERESLLGSACKRLALLEGLARQDGARRRAAARMAEHYARAEALALQAGLSDAFYPALNLLAAELVAHGNSPRWPGFDAERLRRVRENLERKRRDDPDFWSVAGLPELGVYEALAARNLHTQLPGLLAAYEELHRRAGTPWMWASVADQLDFVLSQQVSGGSAHARAAQELQRRLHQYARRLDPPGSAPAGP